MLLQLPVVFVLPRCSFFALTLRIVSGGMFAALKDRKLFGRWSRRRATIAASASQLPTPTASFANRFVLPENSVHLEAGGRFVFQCTFDSLYVYDLLWNVRRWAGR